MENAEDKIIRARSNLILTNPFFATIALRLRIVEDKSQETMWTDSVCLGYNPDFVRMLLPVELRGVIAHEVMHIVLMHPFRCGSRDQVKWNYACDYAVNPILKDDNFILPTPHLYEQKWHYLSADKIYRLLPDSPKNSGGAGMGDVKEYKSGKGDGYEAPKSFKEKEWKVEVSRAASIAKARGMLPGSLSSLIEKILEPVISWKSVLSRFITENSRSDYMWSRPNRRYLHMGIYLPSLYNPTLGNIAVIVDTSASVSNKELQRFASELYSVLQVYPSTTVDVIYVDTRITKHEVITIEDFKFTAMGRGGTDFRPGFAFIESEGIDPSCVIYFTDGECRSFPESPDYPTLWALTGEATFDPPFGETIYIKDD